MENVNPESERFQEGSTMVKYTDRQNHQHHPEFSSHTIKPLGTDRLYSERGEQSIMQNNSIVSEENTRMQTLYGGGGGSIGDMLQRYQ
jgi:hypothetical protein